MLVTSQCSSYEKGQGNLIKEWSREYSEISMSAATLRRRPDIFLCTRLPKDGWRPGNMEVDYPEIKCYII